VVTTIDNADERRRGYAFTATIALERLVAGVVDLLLNAETPPGTTVNQTFASSRYVNGGKTLVDGSSPTGFGVDYQPVFEGVWVSDQRVA